ncbi:MAG: HAMP domain-containing protein [Desulfobacterales bacterium]|nr:MAG: HAMP domain-containing protein [Desulfobacterales bacterium]
MSFRKARHLGLSLIVGILIILGLIPTFVTSRIREHNAAFLSEMHELDLTISLQKLFWSASTEFQNLVYRSEGSFDSVIGRLQKASEISKILENEIISVTDDEIDTIKELQRHTREFTIAVMHYKNEFEIDPAADNTSQLEMIALNAQKQTDEAFSRFIADVVLDVKKNQMAIKQTTEFSQIFSMIGLLLGVSAGIFVAIFIGRSLNKPIQRLLKGTERVFKGELSFRIDASDSDEIGRLAASFNKMSENLQTYIDKQKKLAIVAEEAAESEKKKSEELLRAYNQLKQEVTVRKRVENELIIAKERAEHSSRAKSEFLANMSHELRTPLNHIIGFTELVLDKTFGELTGDQEEYLNDVHASSKHLLSLINDVLDLSKVEAGKLELKPSRVNIRNILENSFVMIKQKATKHGISLSMDLDGIPDCIDADERKLKQIIYNLLSNAIKFTPDGGSIRLTACRSSKTDEQVQDSATSARDYLQVSVEDSGIGLQKEDLERIFQPFEQVESSASRKFQGTGLGLSLTKTLVRLHGGKIWANSEGQGKGATFSFEIPVRAT